MNVNTISDPIQPIEVKQGYESFFAGLTRIVAGREIDDALGEDLRAYSLKFIENCDLSNFQDYSDGSYSRIYLGRDPQSGWEAIMMCWTKGIRTAIHGHPQFAAYNFVSGQFMVETFHENPEGIPAPDKTMYASAGEGFFAVGEKGVFNNHLHRITCLNDTGHSLHIYSDDARKGVCF